MTRPSSVHGREEIARIINPDAEPDRGRPAGHWWRDALAKADAILALISNGTGEAQDEVRGGITISEAQLSEGVKWIDWDGALNQHDEMRQLRKACEQMFGLPLSADCPDILAEEISTIIDQCKGLIGVEHAKAIYSVVVKHAAFLTPVTDVGREAGEFIKSAYDELCVKFSGVHSDDEMDSVLLRLHAALKKLGVDPLSRTQSHE